MSWSINYGPDEEWARLAASGPGARAHAMALRKRIASCAREANLDGHVAQDSDDENAFRIWPLGNPFAAWVRAYPVTHDLVVEALQAHPIPAPDSGPLLPVPPHPED